MKFLYYSTSYYANHGGSIQAIEFYKQLNNVESITEKFIFPVKSKNTFISTVKKNSFREFLRRIPLLQVLFFYRRNQFYFRELTKKIKEIKPDVILLQIDSNFFQIRRLEKLFPDLLICNQINGSPFDEPFKNIAFKKWFLKQQTKAYLQSDLNFFISDFSRKRIMGKNLNQNRDIVIHNGTDPAIFFHIENKKALRIKWNYAPDAFVLGYIGTLDFHKQLGLLVDVFKELQMDFPHLRLVIIGDGPAFPKILARIKKLDLENYVELRGWIKHENINENLNCFDVAVHHYANTYMNPLKIFEYLSAGLPVVGPDIPSVRQAFQNGKDLLITGPTKKELKNSLNEIIVNTDLRERLSNNQNLIHSMEANHTWEKYTDRIIQKISETLEKNKA